MVLIGFMATGKTAVGRALARRLGREFLDTDQLVEHAAGKSVPELFASAGEAEFRAAERDAVAEVSRRRGVVIATGGGVPLDDRNLQALRATGMLVCLTARPETILERLGYPTTRPLLASAADPAAEISRLLSTRAKRYAMADLAVETDQRTIESIVEEICAAFPST